MFRFAAMTFVGVILGFAGCSNSPNYGYKFWTAGYRVRPPSAHVTDQFAWKLHSPRSSGQWTINPMNYWFWEQHQPSNHGGKSILSHTPGPRIPVPLKLCSLLLPKLKY